jgi:ABC-type nitrate/sulfonate/bicarbonate transport system substrate-binding protein
MRVGPDVQLIQIDGFQNQMLALEKGDVDGAILAEPFVTMGVRQGTIKRVLDLMQGQGPALLRNRIWTALMVKDEFLAQRGDVAAKLVRSIARAVDAIYKDPQMTIAVASKNLPTVERPLLEEMIPHLLKANNPKAFATQLTPEAIEAENEWLLKTKEITKKISYDDVVAKEMAKYW